MLLCRLEINDFQKRYIDNIVVLMDTLNHQSTISKNTEHIFR